VQVFLSLNDFHIVDWLSEKQHAYESSGSEIVSVYMGTFEISGFKA